VLCLPAIEACAANWRRKSAVGAESYPAGQIQAEELFGRVWACYDRGRVEADFVLDPFHPAETAGLTAALEDWHRDRGGAFRELVRRSGARA
jgi:hypothetical protein